MKQRYLTFKEGMMKTVTGSSALRERRRTQAVLYKARPVQASVARPVVQDIGLRRLTAQVLDELKRPDAIPSRVLMAALAQAKALGV